MSMKYFSNNWVKGSLDNEESSYHDNLMLRVLNQFRNGVQNFNKASISGNYKRPSQLKNEKSKLPEIAHKKSTSRAELPARELNQTLIVEVSKAQDEQNSVFRRKEQTSKQSIQVEEVSTVLRLNSVQNQKRSSLLEEKKSWYKRRQGGVEMKGVVFRKRTVNQSLPK